MKGKKGIRVWEGVHRSGILSGASEMGELMNRLMVSEGVHGIYFSLYILNRFGGKSVTGFWTSLGGERKVGERCSCSRKIFPFFSDEIPIQNALTWPFLPFSKRIWERAHQP